MQSTGEPDPAAALRRIRAATLAARPQQAPLPKSGIRPVDAGEYWLAAQQYFEAAERFYRRGDAPRGDYCIVRGDAYIQLATLCVLANGSGVPAGAGVSPSPGIRTTEAGPRDAAALRARMAYLRKQQPFERPTIPLEAADENPCLSFLDNAVEHADAAEAASDSGDAVAAHYYSELVDTDLLLLYVCEQIVKALAA